MRRLEQDTPLDGVTADQPSPRYPGSRLGAIAVCGARAMRDMGAPAARFALVRCSVTASDPSSRSPFSAPFRQAHQRTPQVGILTVAVMSVLPLIVAQVIAVLITGAMTVVDRADVHVMADDALDARVADRAVSAHPVRRCSWFFMDHRRVTICPVTTGTRAWREEVSQQQNETRCHVA